VFQESKKSWTFSRRSIHGQIAHELGLRVAEGVYPPESILPNEEVLSAEFDVSRTAYREAIKILAAKRMVEPRPKRGTRVRSRSEWNMLDPDVLAWCFTSRPSLNQLRSLVELRMIIEPAAAAMASERATDEDHEKMQAALSAMKTHDWGAPENVKADLDFHLAVLNASGNELLIPLGYLIETALEQSFFLSAKVPDARENSMPFHDSVYAAIADGNPEGARSAMNTLLSSAWGDLQVVLANWSDDETETHRQAKRKALTGHR
jgi:DNA-binding FadR family transcriptional regulator